MPATDGNSADTTDSSNGQIDAAAAALVANDANNIVVRENCNAIDRKRMCLADCMVSLLKSLLCRTGPRGGGARKDKQSKRKIIKNEAKPVKVLPPSSSRRYTYFSRDKLT